jgi:hypothetical protein
MSLRQVQFEPSKRSWLISFKPDTTPRCQKPNCILGYKKTYYSLQVHHINSSNSKRFVRLIYVNLMYTTIYTPPLISKCKTTTANTQSFTPIHVISQSFPIPHTQTPNRYHKRHNASKSRPSILFHAYSYRHIKSIREQTFHNITQHDLIIYAPSFQTPPLKPSPH